jgi:protein involved in polysaccharide export with SLBB domain
MSDQQVIDYVQQEYAKGTSQESIATNLIRKGVTKEQLQKIKQQQEGRQAGDKNTSKDQFGNNAKQTRGEQRSRHLNNDFENESSDDSFENIRSLIKSKADSIQKDSVEVFGRNIFNVKNLSFSPDVNIPTPVDYRLGPGDEVIIDIWGASQTSVRQTISPDGGIMVDRLGPIYLNGMTIKEANDYVQRKFTEIYSGIDTGGASQIKLTLGQIRTIQINVMGEVVAPGTYALSSLSSVFHALYRAGGVNKIGSLRSVKLYRNGKLLRTLDVYKYILEGKLNDDIRMTDRDVVIVPPYTSLVNVVGNVKRPMYYEMTEGETLANLVRYTGGFTGDAYSKKIKIIRKTGGENKIFTVSEEDFKTFEVTDKDVVTVGAGLAIFENRVEIKGAVFRSGYFEIGKDITTVKELITAADGVRGDAFLNRAVLTREKEDYTTEIIAINLRDLLYENGNDVVLRKNDMLYIPSINDLEEYGDFIIYGEVLKPGEYKYSDNTTLEDLIIQAGGLLESASVVRVDVARRIIDPKSVTVGRKLSDTYTFELKDGLLVEGEKNFVLKPYDQVYVRRSPGYREQQNVDIEGEVLFPGTYAMDKKAERISEIIKRAGNLTPDAYPKGARLVRKRSKEEVFRSETALKIAGKQTSKDSISVKQLDLDNVYSVGIELDNAIKYPGSDYDLVLRVGDKLIIPEYDNTVKINGAVMYPNTVVYKKGEKLSYYINQAGGYADNAKKNKSFVIYMNGTVNKIKSSNKEAIRPGSEIIVPTKEQTKKLSASEIISLGTGVASMASLIGVLINTMN